MWRREPITLKTSDRPLNFDEWWDVSLRRLAAELAVMDAKHPWRSEGAKAVFNARVTRKANVYLVVPTWILAAATIVLVFITRLD